MTGLDGVFIIQLVYSSVTTFSSTRYTRGVNFASYIRSVYDDGDGVLNDIVDYGHLVNRSESQQSARLEQSGGGAGLVNS